jgi:mono/diheme cytochrome c family protein
VSKKWYVEFLLVLALISMAIIFVLNVDFTSTSRSPLPKGDERRETPSAPSPEKEKWLAGKELFKANCASCHNLKFDGVGPPLKGVTARWKAAGAYKGKTGEQWLKVWIRNWHDVVNADYKYGVDMANSRPQQMNIFNWFNDQQLDNILFYVESPDMGKPN